MKRMKKRNTVLIILLCMVMVFSLVCHREAGAAKTSYTIYVNRKTNIVNVVNNKSKKVVRAMYCSTGIRYRTIKGSYRTKQKLRWHALYGGVYGQYCTRISGAYLFHSVPYFSANSKRVETVEYNKLGRQASKGCVRLAVVDAKWIYDNCRLGTKVVIGESKKLKNPTRGLLKISTEKKEGWDPTDPNKKNPYYPTLKLADEHYRQMKVGSNFDPLSVITVSSPFTDRETLLKKVKVTGKVNTRKAGSYKLTYTLKDPATELKRTLKVTFKVIN